MAKSATARAWSSRSSGVLERHVEEGALIARELLVEAVGDRPLGERERQRSSVAKARASPRNMLRGNWSSTRIAASTPSGVSSQDGGNARAELVIDRAEARGDGRIERLVLAEPVFRAKARSNQKCENLVDAGGAHQARSFQPKRPSLYALGGAAIAALIRASASGESQSAGPTRRPISLPSRSMSNVVGIPTAFTAANNLPDGSV